MSEARKILPHESTVTFLVDNEIANNEAIQAFMTGLTAYETERFIQILHHIGYSSFMNGLSRQAIKRPLSAAEQSQLLVHETELALQGAAEFSDYLDEI